MASCDSVARLPNFFLAFFLGSLILSPVLVGQVQTPSLKESLKESLQESPRQQETEAESQSDSNADVADRQQADKTDRSTGEATDESQVATSSAKALGFDPQKTFFSGEAPSSVEELRRMQEKFAELAEALKPAVVNIQMGGSQGSGVVVTSDGYILTAAHVISRPSRKATVTFPDGKRLQATTLGIGRQIDSGILKIDDDQGQDFPYVDLGISAGLNQGQWVIAIGHPGGIDEKRGLVLRVGRILSSSDRVIQTDCTLVGGDSGGPLFDLNGEVVGIHSRIGSNLWDNLHVPVDTYSDNWDKMIQGLVIDGRAAIGLRFDGDSLKVEEVLSGGAAEKAEFQAGDVLLKIGEYEVEKSEDVRRALGNYLPYMKVDVVIRRDDQELTLNVTLGPY
jgi:serine protease Do